ncbi:MAG TPA: PEGA domain-containing protein [Kofleriaceae bacterium]|nr:PEGA domain-containing protein [Kofleriaceae bacterium]
MIRIATAIFVGIIAAGAMSAPARADDEREVSKRWFRAGERAYGAGQYSVAAEAFERSYAALALPAIAFSAAQAYRLQYFVDKDTAKLERAIQLYRAYVKAVKKGGRRDDAVASLAELEPILARMGGGTGASAAPPPAPTRTRLMVFGNIDGASAKVDGATAGTLPVTREVKPGPHKIKVSAGGYFPTERTVTAVKGELVAVEINLSARPATLAIDASDGAVIEVDGRKVGQTPLGRPVEVSPGTRLVTVTLSGHEPFSKTVKVERGETIKLDPALPSTTQRRVSYAVLGTSAALLVGAGVTGFFALRADADASDINDRRATGTISVADLAEYNRRRGDRDNYLAWTYGLAGAGAAVGITGALLYFMDHPEPESQPISAAPAGDIALAPIVGPGLTGVAAAARF